MAEPVRGRRLTDQEGQKLQQIVRRGSTSTVRCTKSPASAMTEWNACTTVVPP
ncbi:hypothetical protein ACIF85_41285 [Streptomyces sp. NPDC086033]|nr:hypothetical protein [Streptomyces sp. LUP47B]